MKRLRWWMMGLLMVGSIINYLTRSTLAVAAPTVLKDLDISTQQYSWIPQRLPVRDHAAAVLRLRHGHRGAEARVRDLRDRMVVHQHGAWRGLAAGRRCSDFARSWDSPKGPRIRLA
jgi:ACS family hexuronate transporter-like MFS transporter